MVRDDDQGQESSAATTTSSKSKNKKRPRKVKAREERYWAEKDGKLKGGEEAEEEEEEKECEEGLTAVAAEGEADGRAAVRASKKAKVTSSAGAGPLSADYLESVQLAKQAEQRRQIHEALRVIESARHVNEGWKRERLRGDTKMRG